MKMLGELDAASAEYVEALLPIVCTHFMVTRCLRSLAAAAVNIALRVQDSSIEHNAATHLAIVEVTNQRSNASNAC